MTHSPAGVLDGACAQRRRILLAATAFLLLSLAPVAAASRAELVLAAEEYPPYEYLDDGVARGIDVESINAVARRLGMRVKIHFMPWARVMADVRRGRVDGAFSMFRTPEREAELYFMDEPLAIERNVLVTGRASTRQARRLEDLAGWTIGVVSDFSYGKQFDSYREVKRSQVTHINQLIRMALTGNRFDAAIVNEAVFYHYVSEFGWQDRFRTLDFVVGEQGLYLGFAKARGRSHAVLARDFSRVLLELRSRGELQALERAEAGK